MFSRAARLRRRLSPGVAPFFPLPWFANSIYIAAMQINLPNGAEIIVLKKAAAAGFGEDVTAYVAHLIATDEPEAEFAPLADEEL